jgi:hypothetical protein
MSVDIEKQKEKVRKLMAFQDTAGCVWFLGTGGGAYCFNDQSMIEERLVGFSVASQGGDVSDLLYEGDKVTIKL